MTRWSEQALWVGPTNNQGGAMSAQMGLILHVMQGSLAGSVAWGKNPASQNSFHFGTSKSGLCQQLVDTDRVAWTQANGNGRWLSSENEDYSGNPLSAQQVEVNAQLYARGVRDYGWPYQLTDSPNIPGLGWHGMGGSAWGNHPTCPGQPIIDQRPQILARAQQINGGNPGQGFDQYPSTDMRPKRNAMFRLIDPDNVQFVIAPDPLSVTGWSYVQISPDLQGWMLVAAGIGTANGSNNDPNHDGHANDNWRPGAFGPSKQASRAKMIEDITAAVVAALPAGGGSGGSGLSSAQVTAAVTVALDEKLAAIGGLSAP